MLKLARATLLLAFAVSGLLVLFMPWVWLVMRNRGQVVPAGFEWCWALAAGVLAASWLGRRRLIRKYQERDRRDFAKVQSESRLEASGRPWLVIALLLLGLICGLGGWQLLVDGDVLGGTCALGAGALLAWAGLDVARIWLRPGPALRMDTEVVDYAAFGPVCWKDVIAIQLESVRVQYHTQNMLNLCVREPHRYVRNMPALMRWIHVRRSRGCDELGPLSIPLGSLNKDPQLIHKAALELRSRHDPPLLAGWHRLMPARETTMWLRLNEAAQETERIIAAIEAAEGDAELTASLELELRACLESQETLFSEVGSTLSASAQRIRQRLLVGWLVAGLALAALVLKLVWNLL